MEVQFYGANCLVVSYKNTRIIVDDNLADLGKKTITKAEDVSLFTAAKDKNQGRLTFNGPGEYEVGDISVIGIAAKPFMNDDSNTSCTMYKLMSADLSILVVGHILGELSAKQLEQIGTVDIMLVPVGNNGYTLDPQGALKLIKDIEPKVIVPTHYKQAGLKYPVEQLELDKAIKELGMEIKERVNKLKIKPADLSDVAQLIVLETL